MWRVRGARAATARPEADAPRAGARRVRRRPASCSARFMPDEARGTTQRRAPSLDAAPRRDDGGARAPNSTLSTLRPLPAHRTPEDALPAPSPGHRRSTDAPWPSRRRGRSCGVDRGQATAIATATTMPRWPRDTATRYPIHTHDGQQDRQSEHQPVAAASRACASARCALQPLKARFGAFALLQLDGEPDHARAQLPDPRWRSKPAGCCGDERRYSSRLASGDPSSKPIPGLTPTSTSGPDTVRRTRRPGSSTPYSFGQWPAVSDRRTLVGPRVPGMSSLSVF